MGNGNQIGIIWQVGNLCHWSEISAIRKLNEIINMFGICANNLYIVKENEVSAQTGVP